MAGAREHAEDRGDDRPIPGTGSDRYVRTATVQARDAKSEVGSQPPPQATYRLLDPSLLFPDREARSFPPDALFLVASLGAVGRRRAAPVCIWAPIGSRLSNRPPDPLMLVNTNLAIFLG